MVKLPCCKQFQPKLTKKKYLYEYVQCSKYFLRCACGVVNTLPPKSMNWRCLKPSCECGKISSEDMKKRIYKFNCGVEFEYDIELVLNCLKMVLFFKLITTATYNVNG